MQIDNDRDIARELRTERTAREVAAYKEIFYLYASGTLVGIFGAAAICIASYTTDHSKSDAVTVPCTSKAIQIPGNSP